MTPSWKKGLQIVLLTEIFLVTVGVLIHEAAHNISFFVLTGRFGQIHLLDSISTSYGTLAVTIPPQGYVGPDTTPFEVIAYGIQFLMTAVFAFILTKLFYSHSNAKKSEMSPTH